MVRTMSFRILAFLVLTVVESAHYLKVCLFGLLLWWEIICVFLNVYCGASQTLKIVNRIWLWSNYPVRIRYDNQSLDKEVRLKCSFIWIKSLCLTQHVWEFSISQRETTLSSPLNTLTPVYNVYKLCRGMW